jgi:hypothetical protein
MKLRWLVRITLLAYLIYMISLTVFACNPGIDAPSRAFAVMILALSSVGMIVRGYSPSYTTPTW